MPHLEEPQRLRIQTQAGPGVIDGLDASEEAPVQIDGIVVRGESGRDGFLRPLQHRVGEGARQREEGPPDALERPAAALEGDQRVLERRRRRIVGDARDLGEVFRDGRFERGQEVLAADPVELRRLEGKRTAREQRIVAVIGHSSEYMAPGADDPTPEIGESRAPRLDRNRVCV